jgi:hypothetical protein
MKLEFSGEIFEKFCNIIFNETSPSENIVVPSGRTGRQKKRCADR